MKEKKDESAEDGDAKSEVYIVGTNHVSEDSYDEVKEIAERINPDGVAVELDKSRYTKLVNTDGKIEDKSIRDIIKGTRGKGIKSRLLMLVLTQIQSKVADTVGSDFLGRDMLAGHEVAKERDIPLALVDRDINKTLSDFSDSMSFKELFIILISYLQLQLGLGNVEDEDIEGMRDVDEMNLEEMEDEFEDILPSFKRIFVDERNRIISRKTSNFARNHNKTILVIGALHKRGVKEILSNDDEIQLVEEKDTETIKES